MRESDDRKRAASRPQERGAQGGIRYEEGNWTETKDNCAPGRSTVTASMRVGTKGGGGIPKEPRTEPMETQFRQPG